MKGIIINLLEEFISERLGDEAYENILEDCSLQTAEPFVGPGSYPDADFMAIAGKAVELMDMSMPDAMRAFGRYCIPKLAEAFPGFMQPHYHPKQFLLTVDSIHYVEVVKLYEDATPPHFQYKDVAKERLLMRYASQRRLCHFMEGLIEGVAQYYDSPVRYAQIQCMHDGADCCEFDLRFTS